MDRRTWIALGVVAAFFLIFGGMLARFYTDWLWFGEVGYRGVFWTRFTSQVLMGVIAGILFFAIVFTNLWLARKLAPPVLSRYTDDTIRFRVGRFASRGFTLLVFALTLGASVLVATETATHWIDYQMFANATEFGTTDPIFGRDIGFYVFKLTFLRYVYGWLFFTVIIATLATALLHYTDRAIEVFAGMPTFAPHVKAHLSVLLAAALLIKSWGYRLDAFGLLYSPTGVVYGAGYTDIHARLMAYQILTVAAMVAAILALVNIRRRGVTLPAAALVILVGASLIFNVVYPGFVQQFQVTPNEIAQESKYVKYNIDATREAFNLHVIKETSFPAASGLTAQDLENNRATINSIRLWDYRPLTKTYSQLQELWPDYDILNVDIDRYVINGQLRQVTLAARELTRANERRAASGTWVNQRFTFTHGYGAVMSPVNRATQEGLPDFFLSGLPPRSNVEIRLDRPQIYFGERTTDYVVANSNEKEFDFPSADRPTYTQYEGQGGIPISGYLPKLALTWRFSDIKLMLKNPITADSRLIFRREIKERVTHIFPFLLYDSDPYLVISDGRLFWMWDAYSVSRKYPYSTPQRIGSGFETTQINYIRNSVKVVVDAYEGTVDFYIADNQDPVLKTYERIFPGVFKPLDEMPADLLSHIRYPELLFSIQAQMLRVYHMQDPLVFYNKGDLWDIPKEIVQTSEEQTEVQPYYIVMKLPGEEREKYVLMLPFTPVNKDNMIAWMAAKCDPEDYGEMILYYFPKEELVYGPAQIETRINQDPVISPQFTLWNRAGTRVSRGNLLVIPIEKSLLYVEPIYLESGSSKIPELKRVIVAYGNHIAMEETLDAALARILEGRQAQAPIPAADAIPPTPAETRSDVRQLVDQAVNQLEKAQDLQRQGDWNGYGDQINRLSQTLKQLREASQER